MSAGRVVRVLGNLKAKLSRHLVRPKPADETPLIAELPRSEAEQAIAIPPADIRYRVVSRSLSEYEYLRVGLDVKASIEGALAAAGTRIEDLSAVLDWGCGCSRVMRHWAGLFGSIAFSGTDIDDVMITWDKANVSGVRFAVNGAQPPLPTDDAEFDLVYGASVFTHLDEPMQQMWLAELQRVLKPGGILLLSTHGPSVFDLNRAAFTEAEAASFRENGFVYIRNIVDGVLPDWYQTSFQTRAHVERTFSPHFDVIDHVARGMTNFQDLAICRKRAS